MTGPTSASGAGPSRAALNSWIRAAVGRLLGVPPEGVDPDRPLTELGLASRDALALVAELEDHLGRRVDPTVVWRTPTITGLVDHLLAEDASARTAVEDVADEQAADEHLADHPAGTRPAPEAAPTRTTPLPAGTTAGTSDHPADDEPVAVVGVGVRLPGGVAGPQAFWAQLVAGRESTGEVPTGRWDDFPQPNAAGAAAVRATPRHGGFLDDVAGFDAEHFGIAPREAAVVDPQQRLLLEVAWEALLHAGVEPASLAGTATGVWVGMSTNEYSRLTLSDAATADAWAATGSALSVAANRLSYLLDLRGPSMTVDTACSSSLVAVHQAVRSLRAGEVSTAVVGGANLLLAPNVTAAFHAGGVLAPDGRCKPFGARADGIVRAEAVGAVVLKRLGDALRDGDRVLAVVRGTGVNSDGRSNGLMAPNPAAQEALLRDVYSRSGIDPATVDYVEAHGTGTLLGDPIEAQALGAVLGSGRDAARPLLVGSVKSNLGHAEAAAGIVALVKTVLALSNTMLPPSLHAAERNPHIRFAEQGLDVVDRLRPWPRYSGTARAGVSAFGFGGTNAHVVLEEWRDAIPAQRTTAPADAVVTAVLTGTDDARVRESAGALADHLAGNQRAVLADVTHTLARRRRHGGRRAVVVGRGRAGLVAALRAAAQGLDAPGVVTGLAARPRQERAAAGAVWVFSGYGSQWPGMGRELLDSEPGFAAAVDELAPLLLAASGVDLRAVVRGEATGPDGRPAGELTIAQSQIAIFGVQVALAAAWRARGHEPAAVVGQSLGEVAAAVVAGGLTLADGVRVISERSRLLMEVGERGGGAMAVLELSGTELDALADRFPDVVVAVHASPRQSTVAGEAGQVVALAEHVESLGRQAWVLPVTGAGHSPAVEPILPELGRVLAGLTPRTPSVPLYTTVLDDPRAAPALDAGYWQANARRPVRFAQAVAAAVADGHATFLEVSPHPVAVPAVSATLAAAGVAGTVLGSLRRSTDSAVTFRTTLAVLAGTPGYRAAGTPADPEGLGVPVARHADLPGPVWRHVRHWAPPVRRSPGSTAGAGTHPLLGAPVRLPGRGRYAFSGDVGLDDTAWLADHAVHGTPVLPAAAFAEMALNAGATALRRSPHAVELDDLELHRLLVLEASTPTTTTVEPLGDDAVRVDVHAVTPSGDLARCATATVRAVTPLDDVDGGVLDLTAGATPTDVRAAFAEVGHRYGPAFDGTGTAFLLPDGRALARVHLPAEATPDDALAVHPALLDACLQVLAPAAAGLRAGADPVPHLPFAVGSLHVPGDPQRGGWCLARVRSDEGGLVGEVHLRADDGTLLLVAREVLLRPLGREAVAVPLADKVFELVEVETPEPEGGTEGPWRVLGDGPLAQAARTTLGARLTDDPAASTLVVCETTAGDQGQADLLRVATAAAGLDAARDGRAQRLAVLTPGGDAPQLAHLRAAVRVLALELPALRARLVHADPALEPDAAAAQAVPDATGPSDDDEVSRRDGRRFARRLARAEVGGAGDAGSAVTLRPGAHVVTGGLGGLGLVTARWLAEQGATRVVLAGRSADEAGLGPVAAQQVREIRGLGVDVVVATADVTRPQDVDGLVAAATAGGTPLRGVVHAAGTLADQLVPDVTADAVDRVWAPKVDGVLALDAATRGHDLDLFCLYTSAAGMLGSPGQLAYAAANAWLDAFVATRRAAGLPASSIAWGAWTGVGGADPARNALLDAMEPAEGVEALAAVVASGRSGTGVVRLDPSRMLALLPGLARSPFLAGVLDPGERDDAQDWAGVAALRALPGQEARRAVHDRLRERVAAVMGQSPERLDVTAPLTTLGVDSLMAVRAKNAVEADFAVVLPVRLLLQGASLSALADHVAGELGLASAPTAAGTSPAPDPSVGAKPTVVGARDTTERWLVSVWAQALGTRPESVTTPLARLLPDDPVQRQAVVDLVREAIEARFGTDAGTGPDAGAVLALPCVEDQADVLRPLVDGHGDGVVRVLRAPEAVTEPGDGVPLFLFHPAGGPTSVYEPMLSLMPADRAVYGLERIEACPTIEEKAGLYVEHVRRLAPHGPYRLGGWSLGGCLAYETAHRLRAEGEVVDLVVLVDTILPEKVPGADERTVVRDRLARFFEHVRQTYGAELGLDPDVVVDLPDDEQIDVMMGAVGRSLPFVGPALLEHQRTSYVDARLAERYVPRPYDGQVVLYRASEVGLTTTLDPRYARVDEALGWDVLCPRLDVVRVPGDHTSLIDRPHVDVVAAHLQQVLDGLEVGAR